MAQPTLQNLRRIAVVDDDAACRTAMCRMLKRRGYATCEFGSVAAFVTSPEPRKIDALLLDVCMPGIDGVAAHTCLQETNFKFPVIFCTGREMDSRLEEALANGAYGLLKKPIHSEALIAMLEAACSGAKSTPPTRHSKTATDDSLPGKTLPFACDSGA